MEPLTLVAKSHEPSDGTSNRIGADCAVVLIIPALNEALKVGELLNCEVDCLQLQVETPPQNVDLSVDYDAAFDMKALAERARAEAGVPSSAPWPGGPRLRQFDRIPSR